MKIYRGFQLMEAVTSWPPEQEGEVSICIREDGVGILANVPTIADAIAWIDERCAAADKMLEAIR